MRLTTVFELLLIFLLIAFAAYGRVIDRDESTSQRRIGGAKESKQDLADVEAVTGPQTAENVTCTCGVNICNCCRNINIPFVQIKGPGCASLQYLENDQLAVQLSMGGNVLTRTTVNGKKPKPVCFPMPGGITKFCGRIYSIERETDEHFKACLRLELQSSSELEAALRVSCFRFGPDGVQLRPAEPLANIVSEDKPSEDDDDDEDFFGLGIDDDDDDDDDDDEDDDDDDEDDDDSPSGNAVSGSSGASEDDDEDDDDDDIFPGFDELFDLLTGGDESDKKKKPATPTPLLPPVTSPIASVTSAPAAVTSGNDSPTLNDVSLAPNPVKVETSGETHATGSADTGLSTGTATSSVDDAPTDSTGSTGPIPEVSTSDKDGTSSIDPSTNEVTSATDALNNSADKITPEESNVIEYTIKPMDKLTIAQKVSTNGSKKPSLTSGSPNAIKSDLKKPAVSSVIINKPSKPDAVQNLVAATLGGVNVDVNKAEEDEDEDDDDVLGTSSLDEEDDDEQVDEDDDDDDDDDDEDGEDDEKNDASEDEKNDKDEIDGANEEQQEVEAVEDLIDDDDDEEDEEEAEEEEAVISALVDDDSDKIQDKVSGAVPTSHEEDDDDDYGLGLTELLTRRRHLKSGRESRVMRL